MRKYVRAGALLTALLLLNGVVLLIFMNKSDWLGSEKVTQNFYQRYLSDKLNLIEQVKQDVQTGCKTEKQSEITVKLDTFIYSYYCENNAFFIKPKPTKEKFIWVDDIKVWLDIERYEQQIVFIRSLSELPASSEDNPQVVMTLNDIDERLQRDFYGIVITPHYFNFTDKKIYGTIYSSDRRNDQNRRNLSYKRGVIERLEQRFSSWDYLPNSRNVLRNE